MSKTSRNTAAKTAITDLLNDSRAALSSSEILDSIKENCDRVTVYRVLNRLIDDGLAHKFVDADGTARFAWCNTCDHGHHHHHDHVHFSCTVCGKVVCLENLVPNITFPKGFKVREAHYTASGVCDGCG